jgi:diguanylate cyclase (GGDEF)-like protein
MGADASPPMMMLTASILVCAAFSFFIVNYRYPVAIKRALILYACACIAIACGFTLAVIFAQTAPQLSLIFNLIVSGAGACLYYFSYRSLLERTYHLGKTGALYALFLVAVVYCGLVTRNPNQSVFAVCVLDMILFGLAARDLLLNLRGHGRAHLIQGICMGLYVVAVLVWGIQILELPQQPRIIIHFGDPASYGLAANCIGAAWGSVNFLLLCNDEFNSRLLKLVATDPLTGLANRRRLIERGAEEIARARRFNHALTALMIDLDHFKALNDAHGHAAGDRALKLVAEVCTATLRDIDLLCRSGGEEFAVLLPETDLARGLEVAERLRRAVAAIEMATPADAVTLSASIGLAELGADDVAIDQVLARADRALYRAKAEGRNRVNHEATSPGDALAHGNPA